MAKARGLAGLKKAAGTKESSTRQSTVPVAKAPAEIDTTIAEWLEADKAVKDWTATKKDAEGRMSPACQQLRVERCLSDGELHASIKVVGTHGVVQFQQQARFTKMRAEDAEDRMRAICGDEEFDSLFQIKTTFTLDAEALSALPDADQIADKLMAALGKHVELLKAESVITPKEEFVRGRIGLGRPRVKELAEQLESEGYAQPISPSFRS